MDNVVVLLAAYVKKGRDNRVNSISRKWGNSYKRLDKSRTYRRVCFDEDSLGVLA